MTTDQDVVIRRGALLGRLARLGSWSSRVAELAEQEAAERSANPVAEVAAQARVRRAQLAAERDLAAVDREDERARRADRQHHRRALAQLDQDHAAAQRAQAAQVRNAAQSAQLDQLYRAAEREGARAKVAVEIDGSAEMRALRIARVRKTTLRAGLPILLGFAAWSTAGAHAGAARLGGLHGGSAQWWAAWAVEPALIAVVALIIVGRSVLRASGGDTDRRATIAEWTALTASLALNVIGGWRGGVLDGLGSALPHMVGPLGAAGTAWIMGVVTEYCARARPWQDAPRLAELGLVEGRAPVPAQPAPVPAQPAAVPAPAAAEVPVESDLPTVPFLRLPTHPAHAAQRAAAQDSQPRRTVRSVPAAAARAVVTEPVTGDDPATRAARRALSGATSIRAAARDEDVPESTVRNRLTQLRERQSGAQTRAAG